MIDPSSGPPAAEAPFTEAAHWFVRTQQQSLSESEWARFGNWFNFSRWNRLAFRQVAMVWQATPSCAESGRSEVAATPARFSWHHADAWRDAVMPLAMNWFPPCEESTAASQRQFLPVRAAAAPAGLL